MGQQTVAVIGASSSGLSMLKTLREDGFKVTCYERRSQVGGLWAYTDDQSMTTALPSTSANISKYTCGMSDFPMPDKYPHYLSQAEFWEYIESYAAHFDLHKDVVLNALVKQVSRNEDDSKWRIDLVVGGKSRAEEYDKVAFCHGYQTEAKMPAFEGFENFEDLMSTWWRRQVTSWLRRTFPKFSTWLADRAIGFMIKQQWSDLDPAWGLFPPPSITLAPRALSEHIIPALKDGFLTSLPGIKRFTGPTSIEFTDGTVLDDIDAVVCATEYRADFNAAPFLERSRPPNYGGADIVRLWMNLFPPKYADSIVMLCYSAFGKNNGFSFSDVTSMAVSNVWRGVYPIPTMTQMEKEIDNHHDWVASRWRLDNDVDVSMVKTWEYQGFLHRAAGTGMENLGWGWKGWKFFFQDPKMSYLMNNGVETAHAFRYFETGKRKAWPGARDAILHMNELVKQFPIKKEKKVQ